MDWACACVYKSRRSAAAFLSVTAVHAVHPCGETVMTDDRAAVVVKKSLRGMNLWGGRLEVPSSEISQTDHNTSSLGPREETG